MKIPVGIPVFVAAAGTDPKFAKMVSGMMGGMHEGAEHGQHQGHH